MSVNYDKEEADQFLAEAAINLADEPGLMLELLDVVASPAVDAVGMEGMAPNEGSEGKLQRERAFAKDPLLALHLLLSYCVYSNFVSIDVTVTKTWHMPIICHTY